MRNSDLYQLIFECLINEGTNDLKIKIEKDIFQSSQNLFRFIHLSSNHLVLPAIYNSICKLKLTEYIENDFNEHLSNINELNKKRNDEILKQISELSQTLFNEGIEPVYLKGSGNLLDNLYLEKTDRIIGDIDFLVQDKDFMRTIEITKKLGYKTDKKIYDDFKYLKDYPHQYSNYTTNIEIHRLPVIIKQTKWFTTEKVFKQKKQIPSRVNCFVPSDNHKLIINFIHSQISDKSHKLKYISLRNLYDAYLLLKRVSRKEVLHEIKSKRKAQVYFDFIPLLINHNHNKSIPNASLNYFRKHTWFLNHPRIHRLYIAILKFTGLVYKRVIMALFSKSTFINLYNRISDIGWWKNRLLPGLKNHFS